MIEKAMAPDLDLGSAFQRLTAERGSSLAAVAVKSGFAESFVAEVATGAASPSVDSLERLLRAIGAGLADLFAQGGAASGVMRRGERGSWRSGWSRARVAPLVAGSALRWLTAHVITIEPGGKSGKALSFHPHEQIACVEGGELVLSLGSATHILAGGDAAAIPAGAPYRWQNVSPVPATLLLVARGGSLRTP